MAPDPRVTGYIDDFNRADESPLSNGGKWSALISTVSPMDLVTNAATHKAGDTQGYSYWNPTSYTGNVEAWGQAEGGNANGIAWGIGLFQNPGGSGVLDGYLAWQAVSSSGSYQKLYRYDNGSATEIASAGPGPSVGFSAGSTTTFMMIRRVAATNKVQLWWVSASTWPSWTLQFDVTDGTYTGAFYLGASITDNSALQILAWAGIGGGADVNRTQIYRWIKN